MNFTAPRATSLDSTRPKPFILGVWDVAILVPFLLTSVAALFPEKYHLHGTENLNAYAVLDLAVQGEHSLWKLYAITLSRDTLRRVN